MSDALYKIGTEPLEVEFNNVGSHFGTIWREDVEAGPLTLEDKLVSWEQPLQLYAMDRFLGVFDRSATGNVLVDVFTKAKRLIAADQSDCFGGVDTILSGVEAVRSKMVRPAICVVDDQLDSVRIEEVIWKSGRSWKNVVLGMESYWPKLKDAASAAAGSCPGEWAEMIKQDPGDLAAVLHERATSMTRILNPDAFDPPEEVIRGGILLDAPGEQPQ